jgi:hypothetical protein
MDNTDFVNIEFIERIDLRSKFLFRATFRIFFVIRMG